MLDTAERDCWMRWRGEAMGEASQVGLKADGAPGWAEGSAKSSAVNAADGLRAALPGSLMAGDTAQSEASSLLTVSELVKEYSRAEAAGGGVVRVVDRVSFTLQAGETLGLVGESGSGKSTIARTVLRLIEPTSGVVRWDGEDLLAASRGRMRQLRRQMQIVFQDPAAALDPRMRVRQILAEPFAIHRERPEEGLEARLVTMLATVGLDADALERYPHQFSGGQRQRINIARALALRPKLLVLDEPVSALDVSVGAQVINLLRELQRSHGLTYLFISHSMPLVRYLCDRVAVLQQGRLVEIGRVLEVCERPREAYTQQLIAATPELRAEL